MRKLIPLTAVLCWPAAVAMAGKADVLEADVDCNADRVCSFSVTVAHDDQGWDHYANKWEVLDPDGGIIGVRELAHPHDTEQPFTRSLGNVEIPAGVDEVTIRAHDSVHGYGGKELVVELPR